MKSILSNFCFLTVLVVNLPLVLADELPKTAAEMGFMQGSPPERLVDISRWDKGPDNRWAFQHISEIIPTANISRGTGAPTVLPRAPRDLSGLVFKTFDGKEMTVKDMLAVNYTDGFIVLHHGKVVFEKYYNGMKPGKLGKVYPDGFYRNQWYITGDDHGSFFAMGVNGQQIWINPTTRAVIVKFASYPISAHAESAAISFLGMDAIARTLGEK